jgi:hypothetical protein
MRHPHFNVSFEELPTDPQARHEVLVDLFGQYLFWVRGEVLSRISMLVESEEERGKLGTLFQGVFANVAGLSKTDQETSIQLAQSAIGNFASAFLTMISGQGFDDPIGDNYFFRFKLDIEICNVDTGKTVAVETINRDGEKYFPEYWGRWLNRYGVSQTMDRSSRKE